jgi:hypothetical protein
MPCLCVRQGLDFLWWSSLCAPGTVVGLSTTAPAERGLGLSGAPLGMPTPGEVLDIVPLINRPTLEVSAVRKGIEASGSWSDSVILHGLSTGATDPLLVR